jgi:predicted nucleic acid-binding protein
MPFVVVLDACVLFPASLRDTLLRAAQANLYRVQLTDDILEEVRRNLVKKRMPEDKAQRLVAAIRENFDDGFVTHYKLLIDSMPINNKDRHVLAAAVACGAEIIVTYNLKDFPRDLLAPFDIKAQSPDDFLVQLFQLNRELMAKVLIKQAGNLHNPSMTVIEVLEVLKQHVPTFVKMMHHEFDFPNTYLKSTAVEAESDVPHRGS